MMIRSLIDVLAAVISLVLILFIWKEVFLFTDWAVVILLPLALFLYSGNWQVSASINQAIIHNVLREDSSLRRWFTGKLMATIESGSFVLLAIPILVWQTEELIFREGLILIALCLAASLCYICLPPTLSKSLRKPFADGAAGLLGTWLIGFIFFIIMVFDIMKNVELRGVSGVNCDTLVSWAISENQHPDRGYITNALAYIHGYESAKKCFAYELSKRWNEPIVGILYSITSAPACFFIARSSIALTRCAQQFSLNRNSKRNSKY